MPSLTVKTKPVVPGGDREYGRSFIATTTESLYCFHFFFFWENPLEITLSKVFFTEVIKELMGLNIIIRNLRFYTQHLFKKNLEAYC